MYRTQDQQIKIIAKRIFLTVMYCFYIFFNLMMKGDYMTTTIIGICLENRIETSVDFQRLITKFGCEIRTRIGLHPSISEVCLNRGIVLLEVNGDAKLLKEELSKEWKFQTMEFEL